MESTSQDLSAGSESTPALGNEQQDTTEMNGFRATSVGSLGCPSESAVQEVVLLATLGNKVIFVPYKLRF